MSNLSDFLSNYSSVSSGMPSAFTNLTAGEAISQGDVVTLGTDGNAYYAADPYYLANIVRPMSSAAQTDVILNASPISPSSAPSVNNGTSASSLPWQTYTGAALSNGNYVVAWQLSATPYSFQFAIFNSSGVQQGNVVTLTSPAGTNTTNCCSSIAPLTGGGFAVAMCTNTAPWLQYAVYDNNGNVVKALATVNATISAANGMVQAIPLSNGGFTLLYSALTNNLIGFAVYDLNGNNTAAFTNLSAAGSGYIQGAAFTAAQGGGFVVAYSTANNGTQVAKYTNAGVLVGSAVATSGSNYGYSNVAVLTGGGWAVAAVTSTTTTTVSVFNSSGTLVKSTAGPAVTGNVFPGIVGLSNGDLAVVTPSAASGSGLIYYSGTTGNKTYAASGFTAPAAILPPAILPTKTGGVQLVYQSYMGVFDSNANLLSKSTATPAAYSSTGTGVPVLFAITNSIKASADAAIFAVVVGTTLCIAQIVQYMGAFIPIGIATAAAAAGGTVKVQVLGAAQTRINFFMPYTINTPVQRMTLLGNLALMQSFGNQIN